VHLEPDADRDLHPALAAAVRSLAEWLDLAEVRTPDPALARALDG
jgi:hypothetical protein